MLRRRGDLRAGEYDEGQAAILLAERRALPVRFAGEERLIAAEDAGRYRDALGVMPPGGLPEAFLEGGADSLRQLVLRFAKGRGPFTTAEADERFGLAARGPPARARARRPARPRRAPSRRQRARVVRPGRAAPAPARLARRAPPRGRAGRAGGARPLPAGLARDRPARRPARGARAAAGARAAGHALGERGAAAARARLPARAGSTASAPPASSSGSAPGSTGSPSTSATTRRCSASRPGAPPPETREAQRDPRGARRAARCSGTTCSSRQPASSRRTALPALWELVWAGEVTNDAWTPLRAGRRYQAPRDRRAARAASRARAAAVDHVDAGPLVAHRPALPRRAPTGARSRSCCSSGRGSSPATASAARGSRAATAPSTPS